MGAEIPRYIVIEGPIGVGKTTLAEGLAQRLNGRLLFEQFEENPFLPLFYEDRKRYAFQTELFFLLGRFKQQEGFVHQQELFQQHTISDYLFAKCRMFANITLDDHELNLFDETYRILSRSIPQPDLLIHLQAPVEVLLERIAHRGRVYERQMDPAYLEQLCQLYGQEFHRQMPFPVIHIDTTEIDFRDPKNIDHLLEYIASGRSGRLEFALSPQ